ncbi:MAG: signal peptidase II, partial [Bdellovibrionales bacterium]|nr:signal peptidase II [Bdellovibrionales bacterium]
MRSIKSLFLIKSPKQKTNILLISLLLSLMLVDQVTKNAFIKWLPFTKPGETLFGFSFHGVFNEGLILNLQIKGMDVVFGALIFTLLLITLLFFYVAGLRWLSQTFYTIKVGITFLCGGVFSNLLDKIRHGQVLDFIKFQLTENSVSFFFNTADIFQTIGWVILIYGGVKLKKQ